MAKFCSKCGNELKEGAERRSKVLFCVWKPGKAGTERTE